MENIMEAIKLYDVLGDLAGHLTILSGGDLIGGSTTTINPGIVAINGEVLFFEGGPIGTNVFIDEIDQYETFEDQTSKILIKRKVVKFGNATPPNSFLWTDFVKLQTIKSIQIALSNKADLDDFNDLKVDVEILKIKTAPIENGGIVFIFRKPASDIPLGWKECTDLRGKTVFGYDPNNPLFNVLGDPGGSEKKTLLVQNIPALAASITTIHPYEGSPIGGGFDGGGNQWKNKNQTINTGGTSEPFDVLNPHRVILFIEPNFQ